MFWNLLRNALRHTPPGGLITTASANPAPDHGYSVEVADSVAAGLRAAQSGSTSW